MASTAKLTIGPVTVAQIRDHGSAMLFAHWSEVGRHKDILKLNPDWLRYSDLEAAGMLLALAAYADSEIVGYSVSFLTRHIHYQDVLVAQNDVLFVFAHERKGGVGLRLIRATEEAAREAGAKLMLWHSKTDTALGELMPRLGYGVQDIVWSQEL